MIPGFSPIETLPQSHIHLGLVAVDGSGPSGFDGDSAPPYKLSVLNRMPIYPVPSSFDRSWDLTPFAHVARDDSSNPIVLEDLQYELLVDDIGMQLLKRLFKNYVYLVDSRHCPDGQDHTPYVHKMWFADFQYGQHLDPLLKLNNVTITFSDAYTVAPL